MHTARYLPGGLAGAQGAEGAAALAGVALRSGRTVLDMTPQFVPARINQLEIVRQSFRFFDGEMDFQEPDISLLLKALKDNPMEQRARFFQVG